MNETVHTQAPSFSLNPAPNLIFVSQPGESTAEFPHSHALSPLGSRTPPGGGACTSQTGSLKEKEKPSPPTTYNPSRPGGEARRGGEDMKTTNARRGNDSTKRCSQPGSESSLTTT